MNPAIDAAVPATTSRSAGHPAARLSAPVRVAAAAVLLAGSALQAAVFVVDDPRDLRTALNAAAADPDTSRLLYLLDTMAVPILLASVAVYVLLGRQRSPKTAWIGGWLMALGLVELGIHRGGEATVFDLVSRGELTPKAAAGVFDAPSLTDTVAQLGFLAPLLIGTLITVVALCRSHAVPRPAAALLVVYIAVGLTGFGLVAHLVAFAANAWIAACVLRARSWPGL
jgi:hypothetical protein